MAARILLFHCAWLAALASPTVAQPFDPPRIVPSPDGTVLATGHWDGSPTPRRASP